IHYMIVYQDQHQYIINLYENNDFLISLLYIDVDLDRLSYNGLKYLWDRILPSGIILFDEY
ncbi:MAG: hypothetical protein ACKPKO_48935, partial [Candidatus Fonsibacter sp.]